MSLEGGHDAVHEQEVIDLEPHREGLLASLTPGGKVADPDELIRQLSSIATNFATWRRQPPAPKALVRKSLADLAVYTAPANRDLATEAGLRRRLHELPAEAWTRYCRSCSAVAAIALPGEKDGDLLPASFSWDAVHAAAKRAAEPVHRGDYRDADLALATSLLTSLLIDLGICKPTMNRDPSRPSTACRIARSFFVICDPALPPQRIDNALAKELRSRRSRAN